MNTKKTVLIITLLMLNGATFAEEDWIFLFKNKLSVSLFDKNSIKEVEGTAYKSLNIEDFFYNGIKYGLKSISYSKSIIWVDCNNYSVGVKEQTSYTHFDQVQRHTISTREQINMGSIAKGSGKAYDLLLSQYVCNS